MSENNYSKRELDSKFDGIHERFSNQDKTLEKILIQTTKHNSRMSKIEKILLVVGCVAGTLLIVNGGELVSFVTSII